MSVLDESVRYSGPFAVDLSDFGCRWAPCNNYIVEVERRHGGSLGLAVVCLPNDQGAKQLALFEIMTHPL